MLLYGSREVFRKICLHRNSVLDIFLAQQFPVAPDFGDLARLRIRTDLLDIYLLLTQDFADCLDQFRYPLAGLRGNLHNAVGPKVLQDASCCQILLVECR